jgi:hypothetical protein
MTRRNGAYCRAVLSAARQLGFEPSYRQGRAGVASCSEAVSATVQHTIPSGGLVGSCVLIIRLYGGNRQEKCADLALATIKKQIRQN